MWLGGAATLAAVKILVLAVYRHIAAPGVGVATYLPGHGTPASANFLGYEGLVKAEFQHRFYCHTLG